MVSSGSSIRKLAGTTATIDSWREMPQGRRIIAYRRFEFEGVFFVDLAKGQQVAAPAEICGSGGGVRTEKNQWRADAIKKQANTVTSAQTATMLKRSARPT